VLIEIVIGPRYGVFRDELYYLACADHLAWGYVDQPPFSILVLAGVRALLGEGLFALRLVPAVLGGALVVLGARLARELGGGGRAQLLAALAVAIVPQYLGIFSFYSMNAFDLVLWSGSALVLARTIRTDDVRLWLPLGLLIGIGLVNKISPLFFAFGLAMATVATPLRRHLRGWQPYAGAMIALALLAPYVIWNATHDWATLEFMERAARYKNAPLSVPQFLGGQLLEIHPFNAALWLGGLGWLLVGREGRRFRALGILYLAVLGVMLATNAKVYYLGPAYPMLLAAGAVGLERVTAARGRRWALPAVAAVLVAGGALTAPLAVPLLPVETFIAYQQSLGIASAPAENSELGPLPQHFADRFGWREMAEEVARAYGALSAEDREGLLIVTGNYGEAGALRYFGPDLGLPAAVSWHNSYYHWGPGTDTVRAVLTVGIAPEDLMGSFTTVEVVGTLSSPYAMPFETALPILLARGPLLTLDEIWRRGKNFI
jgi:4-amino-4-deoxy-L-arabinose transferase-like glycosyltransferase